MLDAEFIKECADPSLKSGIVEQFVQAAGSADPLAITVTSGGRLVLVPKPKTPEQAMAIIRDNVSGSIVRVGLTQFPAGVGITNAAQLKPDLVEPCANLRMGTAMFSKILRIVSLWYGNPTNDEVLPQLFDDALHAWRTGEFEGENVFLAEDSGGAFERQVVISNEDIGTHGHEQPTAEMLTDIPNAEIRVDLTRIGGQK